MYNFPLKMQLNINKYGKCYKVKSAIFHIKMQNIISVIDILPKTNKNDKAYYFLWTILKDVGILFIRGSNVYKTLSIKCGGLYNKIFNL